MNDEQRTRSSRRRLLLGHAGPDPQARRRDLDPRRLSRRRRAERDLSQPRHATPRRSRSSSIRRGSSYRKLLEFFFQIHDPTTRNRQGNDVGTSYRSAIFYTSDEQKRVAEDTIADVDASGLWPGKVVTEVAPAGPFWEAEPEHQDYLRADPERLHLPLRPAGLEAAGARHGGPLRSRLAPRRFRGRCHVQRPRRGSRQGPQVHRPASAAPNDVVGHTVRADGGADTGRNCRAGEGRPDKRDPARDQQRAAANADRQLLYKFPDEAAHRKSHRAGLDVVNSKIRLSAARFASSRPAQAARGRSGVPQGQVMPPALQRKIEANDASFAALTRRLQRPASRRRRHRDQAGRRTRASCDCSGQAHAGLDGVLVVPTALGRDPGRTEPNASRTIKQRATFARDLQRAVARVAPDWTDFGAHDPGVTVLELLAFALEDLRFRHAALDPARRLLARDVAARPRRSRRRRRDSDDCGPGPTRVDYFTGMVLGSDDFSAEQDYFRSA